MQGVRQVGACRSTVVSTLFGVCLGKDADKIQAETIASVYFLGTDYTDCTDLVDDYIH